MEKLKQLWSILWLRWIVGFVIAGIAFCLLHPLFIPKTLNNLLPGHYYVVTETPIKVDKADIKKHPNEYYVNVFGDGTYGEWKYQNFLNAEKTFDVALNYSWSRNLVSY